MQLWCRAPYHQRFSSLHAIYPFKNPSSYRYGSHMYFGSRYHYWPLFGEVNEDFYNAFSTVFGSGRSINVNRPQYLIIGSLNSQRATKCMDVIMEEWYEQTQYLCSLNHTYIGAELKKIDLSTWCLVTRLVKFYLHDFVRPRCISRQDYNCFLSDKVSLTSYTHR